ncbi:hypothetical protein M0L20_13580 [Spirosoma sp. RP8]|uniref:Transposase n=1 Tax=Spirosoma liriopis TaxID=2937440 RepID=A0ABT0HML2_9BACT|nr:hypothetical protein [Spirosoma liriopis]MCK8492893.1 hypothetical protein [Spirosoma liriopis]
MFGIYLSQVLAEYRASGTSGHSPFFDLTYRKADGAYGGKTSVRRRAGDVPPQKKDLTSIKHENRHAGKLHLIDQTGHKFELHIPLLLSYNGKLIDHRF